MAKAAKSYVCQSCGAAHGKWQGKCDACGRWNTIIEEAGHGTIVPKGLSAKRGQPVDLVMLDQAPEPPPRIETGIKELDRALGGGVVPGSATLIGGDPGIGKSTILLQAVGKMAERGLPSVYFSGEEAPAQIQMRARRLGIAGGNLAIGAETSVRNILATLAQGRPPAVVVIDSIQTMFVDNVEAAPGTVTQVRTSAQELIRFTKARNIALMLVGHVTKDGQIAGPRVLEHMVDSVLYFEGERNHQFRILRAVKNRFGGTDEIGVFEMTAKGLVEVPNPSALFLSDRAQAAPGAAVFAGLEGTRPLLVEIQALVAASPAANPRRAVVGWDSARLAMILAVLDARLGLGFAGHDVYLNVAGGLRISEPAADLAVAAALISSLTGRPLATETVAFGEISLSGDVRPVPQPDLRLKEARKLGFASALVPAGAKYNVKGIRTEELARLQELLDSVGLD
ncbi:MAG: DNA repair protein RadA [Sphingomonadales bacterium]